jgi:hypothetical protein
MNGSGLLIAIMVVMTVVMCGGIAVGSAFVVAASDHHRAPDPGRR